MYNIYDMNSGMKFIKKEDDDIGLDIDFDINKIRTNFDPKLYSTQTNIIFQVVLAFCLKSRIMPQKKSFFIEKSLKIKEKRNPLQY